MHSAKQFALFGIGGVALSTLALVNVPWTMPLLWPALAMLVIAMGYAGLGGRIFSKRRGRVSPMSRLLLGPYLLGLGISRRYYWRRSERWHRIRPNVIVGRLVVAAEAQDLISSGVVAVLDLTAEHSECAPLLALPYLNRPVLDLTSPTTGDLHAAADFIQKHAGDGVVYVHCGLGYSRSAMAVAAWLLKHGEASDLDRALDIVEAHRPGVTFGTRNRRVLADFARSLQ